MSDPLALLPLALAAAGGRIDDRETAALVAAGLTLLQRSAPLVRTLSGHRSAILLPPGPAVLVALAASDGRGALWLDAASDAKAIAPQLRVANVGAIFSLSAFADRIPAGVPVVWLDDAPRTARVDVGDQSRTVDLGSHFGLALEGDREAAGRDEECVLHFAPGSTDLVPYTHRDLLSLARQGIRDRQLTPVHETRWLATSTGVDALLADCLTPLLIGGRVATG
jgi:hypothetical protein